MLKNISNLGTTLNKSEQQSINGGVFDCHSLKQHACPDNMIKDENCYCVYGSPS